MQDAPRYLRLSELLGRPVRDGAGATAGRVADVAVALGERFPPVSFVLVRVRGVRAPIAVPASAIAQLDETGVRLSGSLRDADGAIVTDSLLLSRDVLDVQVVDTIGRRMARVGDVDLADEEGALRVIAVDVGWRAILRRLGLRRLARRATRDAIDWADIHLAGGPGHPLQLSSPAAAVHRLDAGELAELLALLTPRHGAQVLDALATERAAAALAAAHPELADDLLEALDPERAAALRALLEHVPPPEEPAAPAPRPRRRYWRILRGHAGPSR